MRVGVAGVRARRGRVNLEIGKGRDRGVAVAVA